MDHKTMTIREAENGYIISRNWCEKDGDDREYHSEEYVMKTLPAEMKKLFDGGMEGQKVERPDERKRMSFDEAMKEADKSMKEDESEKDEE